MSGEALLTLNAGSSSIKFGLYGLAAEPVELVSGQVENLGPAARLTLKSGAGSGGGSGGGQTQVIELGAADHPVALQAILRHAAAALGDRRVAGVGHRIAHGGIDFDAPRVLDEEALSKLKALSPLAPLHQPHNLAAVAAAKAVFPGTVQIGCFDTAFHRGHPWVNDTFAIPRAYYDKGVRRYGFHGLSYDYVAGTLKTVAPDIASGRVIIAHLGNGASMCAIKDGQSVASTMGFSALDGLPMGTRCGQLDPGVLLYLMSEEGLSPEEITALLYKESGLKGLSGLTHDMRTLQASEDPHAKQAIDYFVFRLRREIGAMCAILEGIDALVFCGGIGENSARVRERACDGLDFLGIALNPTDNAANNERISSGQVPVLVIKTDEERVIARALASHLISSKQEGATG